METLKKLVKKYFENFAYFYSHLRHKIFLVVLLNIIVGVLDGFGLTMFLPLLKLVNDTTAASHEDLGNLKFVTNGIESLGFTLNLVSVLIFMALFFVLKGLTMFIQSIYQVRVQQYFIKKVRISNIKGLNNLSYKYFAMADAGRIQNTLTGEVDRVSRAYQSYFQSFQYGVMVLIYMVFAFMVNSQFAILVSIGGLLTNVIYKNIYKNTKGASRKLTSHANILQGLIIQSVANYKYLKATGSLDQYGKKIEGAINKIEVNNRRIGILGGILKASREPLILIVVLLVIYIEIEVRGSALASILMSLLFFYRALSFLMMVQSQWNTFLATSGSLENMTAFEREMKLNKEKRGKTKITSLANEMRLSGVSFYYDKTAVIKDVSLTINKNEVVAFVGESGSGKTTLVNLFAGLLPVSEGNYTIDGIPSKEIDITSWQQRIGYITQDPVIFNDTILSNISFWQAGQRENASRFETAAKKASIYDYIMTLPEKENTVLGNNGINLSGGQKQRISIARELYKDVDMLILDEATSALDSETEKVIQQNIDALRGQYTILIIAHRLSTIKDADRIVFMKNGTISEVGTFQELTERVPSFKKMVELQEI